MKKNNLYIIRKFIIANSAMDAVKNEGKHPVHDVFLEENSFKESILETVKRIKDSSSIGFSS